MCDGRLRLSRWVKRFRCFVLLLLRENSLSGETASNSTVDSVFYLSVFLEFYFEKQLGEALRLLKSHVYMQLICNSK